MGWGSKFRRQVSKMASKLTHAVVNPVAELAGGVTGSRSTQERIKGAGDVIVGGVARTASFGTLDGEQMNKGIGNVITGGASGERSEEEIKIFSIPELELTDEQRRVKSAVEAREKQKQSSRGRSSTILTGQKQSTQGDSILTTQKGTSILGR